MTASIGGAEIRRSKEIPTQFVSVELSKGLKLNPEAIEYIDKNSRPNIAVFDDATPQELITDLRNELQDNIRDASLEDAHDEYGPKHKRRKLFDPLLAMSTGVAILTSPDIKHAIAHFEDYAFRSFFNGFADRFEASLVRYSDGGFYRWHTDHQKLPDNRRVLVYVLFLKEPVSGGFLEINTRPLTDGFVDGGGLTRLEAQVFIRPKVGRLVLFPTYLVHRVTPTVGIREVLLGHACLGNTV